MARSRRVRAQYGQTLHKAFWSWGARSIGASQTVCRLSPRRAVGTLRSGLASMELLLAGTDDWKIPSVTTRKNGDGRGCVTCVTYF